MKHSNEDILKLDRWIKHGRIGAVQRSLKATSFRDISREHKSSFASIARRANLSYWALRLLNPIVRTEVPIYPEVSEDEIIQYAACLIRIGNLREGFELLESINTEIYPEVLLFKSIGLIGQWKQGDSIPLLKSYIRNSKTTGYQKLIGQVNLATSYVSVSAFQKSNRLLDQIIKKARKNNYKFLLGYIIQHKGQVAFKLGKYTEAREYFLDSTKIFGPSNSLYKFFSKKWLLFSDLQEKPFDKVLEGKLNSLRNQAQTLGHGETLRECDLFEAIKTQNLELINRVYFGTDSNEYKLRILRMWRTPFQPQLHYDLKPMRSGGKIFDLKSGKILDSPAYINSGGSIHRCLNILCQDLYRPITLGYLFSQLYRNEQFNPMTSPDRIYKTIKRLRKSLGILDTGLRIDISKNQIQMNYEHQKCILRMPLTNDDLNKKEVYLEKLRFQFKHRAFSASKAGDFLRLSIAQAIRVVKYGVENGSLNAIGRGRSVQYYFTEFENTD